MALNTYDFEDFLRTSKNGFRLYNNNFAAASGDIAAQYSLCGERLLILCACLRLVHDEGSNLDGLFMGNRQAKVERCVARIGDFRTTVEELGAMIRRASRGGRYAWESLTNDENIKALEKLSSDMDNQSLKIQDILVLDYDVNV